MTLLRPGQTCWRLEPANRAAFLIDTQAYFTAAYEALLNAKRQILLLGWGFDPRTRLAPDGGREVGEDDEIGRILLRLSRERPDLEIHVLIWKSALPVRASQEFFPHRARPWFRDSRVQFHLDDTVPLGACHHQKALIVDDQVAIVGGGDLCADRWDSTAHLDEDNRRTVAGHCHVPRHEVMMMVDGAAAAALGDHARERWRVATGEALTPPKVSAEDAWPAFVTPDLEDIKVGIARTQPAWKRQPAIEEIRTLTLASIARARRCIYLENQYLTSPNYAELLAARLAEPDGPEVVMVSTRRSPSWFDQLTMDRARGLFIRRLNEAAIFGRVRAFYPETSGGQPIIVHSKVTVIDDHLVRVGSANMNNRSGGFDTELELAIEAETDLHRTAIAVFRGRLVGHYISRTVEAVARASARNGGLGEGIEALNRMHKHRRLHPIVPQKLTKPEQVIAAFHLGDPTCTADSMRPLRRREHLHRQIRETAAATAVARWAGLPFG